MAISSSLPARSHSTITWSALELLCELLDVVPDDDCPLPVADPLDRPD